jgi:hypothetical protein
LTYNENLGSTAQIAKHPIHPMLVPFPIVCFVGTPGDGYCLCFDGGDYVGRLLGMAGVDRLDYGRAGRHRRPHRLSEQPPDPRPAAGVAAHARQHPCARTRNTLVHTRDAWTSVVPTGLILSAIVVLILPVTGWLGWSMVYRHGVGVVR